MTMIRTLIVDDEPLAREGLRRLLETDEDVDIIGDCSDGIQAVETIRATRPDLVLLDIQMPEVDGFKVIERIGAKEMPCLIFVTAYDEHALKAFEVHALDYLLKPVDPDRFAESLLRAKESIAHSDTNELARKLTALLEGHPGMRRYLDRVMVKGTGRISFVKTDEIDWIEADGDYVCLHTQGKSHLTREKISELEQKLDPANFGRIHRSTIINLNRMKEIQPLFSGEYVVIMNDGKRLTLSRTYRDKLISILNQGM